MTPLALHLSSDFWNRYALTKSWMFFWKDLSNPLIQCSISGRLPGHIFLLQKTRLNVCTSAHGEMWSKTYNQVLFFCCRIPWILEFLCAFPLILIIPYAVFKIRPYKSMVITIAIIGGDSFGRTLGCRCPDGLPCLMALVDIMFQSQWQILCPDLQLLHTSLF